MVSPDRRHAVYAAVAVATPVTWPPGQVTLSGLDDDTTYAVRPLPPGHIVRGPEYSPLPWWATGVTLPGRVLGTAGVQLPALHPEQLVLIEATAV